MSLAIQSTRVMPYNPTQQNPSFGISTAEMRRSAEETARSRDLAKIGRTFATVSLIGGLTIGAVLGIAGTLTGCHFFGGCS